MRHAAAIKDLAFILTSRFVGTSLTKRDSLVRELLSRGDAAIGLRQWEGLREVGNALTSLPLPDSITAIGRYYTGYALYKSDPSELARARREIEGAARLAPAAYLARATQSLAALAKYGGEQDEWPRLYAEAMRQGRAARDLHSVIHAGKMLAIRRAVEGDHRGAIGELESLFPLLRLVAKQDPATYLDVLNSLAVELAELGRLDEAAAAVRIVEASPLIDAYPEWRQSAEEIDRQQARPLIIAVPELERAAVAVIALVIISIRAVISRAMRPRPARSPARANGPRCIACRAGPRAPPVLIL